MRLPFVHDPHISSGTPDCGDWKVRGADLIRKGGRHRQELPHGVEQALALDGSECLQTPHASRGWLSVEWTTESVWGVVDMTQVALLEKKRGLHTCS